jgi:hypothetical protein
LGLKEDLGMKKFCLFIILLLAFPVIVFASSVTLEWSPNSEPDLVGYRVFARDWNGNYNYTQPVWEGTAVTCTILVDGYKLPHFVARAYDLEGFESGDSNEVYLSNGPPASPGNLIILQGN